MKDDFKQILSVTCIPSLKEKKNTNALIVFPYREDKGNNKGKNAEKT